MKQQFKKQKEHEKAWESSRDTRVGTWRDYLKGGAAKKASKHLKPPKQKTWDEEKTYVQRPAGEQHRPPPPKPAGPKKA
jgi:DnaJ family protein C protein 8